MRQGRFCDFYHKIASVFVQKNKSKYDRIAVRSDVSIGDGQIAAQLIFIHAVGQRHRYAAASAGQIKYSGALPCRGLIVPDNSAAADLVPHRTLQRQRLLHGLAPAQEV